MAHVHRHEEAFDDRNAFLLVTLGALSLCRQLAELVVSLGPASSGPSDHRSPENDRFLYAALGVASLLRLAVRGIESTVPSGILPPTQVVPAEDARGDLRSILA